MSVPERIRVYHGFGIRTWLPEDDMKSGGTIYVRKDADLVERLKDANANWRYGDFSGEVPAEFWKQLLRDVLKAMEG